MDQTVLHQDLQNEMDELQNELDTIKSILSLSFMKVPF